MNEKLFELFFNVDGTLNTQYIKKENDNIRMMYEDIFFKKFILLNVSKPFDFLIPFTDYINSNKWKGQSVNDIKNHIDNIISKSNKFSSEIFLINGDEFLEKYNDDFFLVPYASMKDYPSHLRTIFHKSEEEYAKLENASFQGILKSTFYACREVSRLNELQLIEMEENKMENQIKKVHFENFSFMGQHYNNVDVYSLGDSVSVVKDGKVKVVRGNDEFQEYVFNFIEER